MKIEVDKLVDYVPKMAAWASWHKMEVLSINDGYILTVDGKVAGRGPNIAVLMLGYAYQTSEPMTEDEYPDDNDFFPECVMAMNGLGTAVAIGRLPGFGLHMIGGMYALTALGEAIGLNNNPLLCLLLNIRAVGRPSIPEMSAN